MTVGVRINKGGYEVYTKSDRQWKPIFVHVVVAENLMGGDLPCEMDVHHLDLNKRNNSDNNLMVCCRGYHLEMHRRENALSASGKSWYRKCWYCGKWDNPKNLAGNNKMHLSCKNKYSRERRKRPNVIASDRAKYQRDKDKINTRKREWRAKKKELVI